MLAFTKTHLIVLILTSTKSNEAQSAQTSAWCSVPAKLDSSTRLPTSLSRTPKFSTKQNDILPLRIFKTDWLTHCRTKHDYLSMVKFKSVHFSRSDEVCFFFAWFPFQKPCFLAMLTKPMPGPKGAHHLENLHFDFGGTAIHHSRDEGMSLPGWTCPNLCFGWPHRSYRNLFEWNPKLNFTEDIAE